MSKVFLSHSSSDKKSYVDIVAKQLTKRIGRDSVILDEFSFQEGRKTIEEIEESLANTDLFVVFISLKALESEWVRKELFRAEQLWSQSKLEQICPIIIDREVRYDNEKIPDWLRDNYNLQYIGRPTKATQIIAQRMVELTYIKHPRLKERKDIFVGRNDLIKMFEERMDNFEKEVPICVVASGLKSIGRTALLKHCIVKSNIRKVSYQFATISLDYDNSIEDFILRLYDLGFTREFEVEGLMKKSIPQKINILIGLIKEIQSDNDIVFIEDKGCIINYNGEIAKWFIEVLKSSELTSMLTICIVAKFRLSLFGDSISLREQEKIFVLEVSELDKKERDGLLVRYARFEGVDLDLEDKRLISGLLSGYPEQVFYAVSLVEDRGIQYLKNHTDEIVEYNNRKASILLKDYENDEERLMFLALLSAFDYIGTKFIFDIVGDDDRYKEYIQEFILTAICEYVGVMKEYIRVNETIKEYIIRNNYQISVVHKNKMKEVLNNFLKNLKNNEYDIPEYLFSLKEAVLNNMPVDEKYIIPSLYLKTMNELYIQRKNKAVVEFANKALENEEYMDDRIVFEIRYLLCSALAKLKDKRFSEEVSLINKEEHLADYYFLYGFYYRQIDNYVKALKMLNKAMEKRPKFSKAKRELVQVYIGLQEFSIAKELARENYLNYKDNPYHIQAYFTCLIKAEKNNDNLKILNTLVDSLDSINSDTAKEMALRCKAQMQAFYHNSKEEALDNIDKAININPNIQYARLVKFDICDRFCMLDEMKSILKFFQQTDNKKYQNNIVCFKSIILAREGNIDKAIIEFNSNIKGYTDEAKNGFINKLKKYKCNNE